MRLTYKDKASIKLDR